MGNECKLLIHSNIRKWKNQVINKEHIYHDSLKQKHSIHNPSIQALYRAIVLQYFSQVLIYSMFWI